MQLLIRSTAFIAENTYDLFLASSKQPLSTRCVHKALTISKIAVAILTVSYLPVCVGLSKHRISLLALSSGLMIIACSVTSLFMLYKVFPEIGKRTKILNECGTALKLIKEQQKQLTSFFTQYNTYRKTQISLLQKQKVVLTKAVAMYREKLELKEGEELPQVSVKKADHVEVETRFQDLTTRKSLPQRNDDKLNDRIKELADSIHRNTELTDGLAKKIISLTTDFNVMNPRNIQLLTAKNCEAKILLNELTSIIDEMNSELEGMESTRPCWDEVLIDAQKALRAAEEKLKK